MHAVIETPEYLTSAAKAGLSEAERDEIVKEVSENPEIGDLIPGTGGCRKFRFAGRGKGKSGGFRVITFYSGDNFPVFLFTAFGKGQKANISKSEANVLKSVTKLITQTYRK